MKIKAAVMRELDGLLSIEELDIAPPKENEVLIKTTASGICHSDYSVLHGVLRSPLPVVLGHEGAGIVEAVGPGVTNVKPGDHVLVSLSPSCGKCAMCLEEREYLCMEMSKASNRGTMMDGTTRLTAHSATRHTAGTSSDEEEVRQLCGIASFAEKMVVPAGCAIKIRDDAPLETCCLIGCGVTTGTGAAINTADIHPGNSVAVIGCGGVGLSILQGARIKGAHPIIAVDPVAEKRALALSLGATHAIDPFNENLKERIKEITGKGVHFSFEALGSMKTINDAYSILRPTGEAIIVGVPNLKEKYELPVYNLFAEKELRGSVYGSSRPKRDLPMFVDWYMDGKLKLDELITKRIRLEDVNQALEEMGRGEGARSVIMFD
ncbi:MAG: dehydrogenase [Moraxellaceae bacterium]|nr:MAG: dehydrogenase [Moraxellaceae bacterium]